MEKTVNIATDRLQVRDGYLPQIVVWEHFIFYNKYAYVV